MIHFERSLTIDATPETIWGILGRFMHIDSFAPEITSVDALTQGPDGIGSRRRNHFKNGTSLVEEATAWEPGVGYTVALFDMAAMPLRAATSTIRITPQGTASRVIWTFDYRVKYGPLGWLLGQTLMKLMMGKVIDANLYGLAEQAGSIKAA
ncbi:SRPBCC family protein [Shimia abyssi]|uniref:Carbon monoxide dehydrogenase subunit G n=1 Tax=Shimia abyssi TaxID=1662395 RepID=A0A2P8FGS8_9RHOB|nr:SRPBCC family protein [Shimia abyssi]PSL20934.1 carbon monoxide dehydrogenase subunit G [Shimia abyssi]